MLKVTGGGTHTNYSYQQFISIESACLWLEGASSFHRKQNKMMNGAPVADGRPGRMGSVTDRPFAAVGFRVSGAAAAAESGEVPNGVDAPLFPSAAES